MRKRGIYWQARPKAGGKLGKWRSTRCTDKKAAETVLADWERELADPVYAASKGCTLDQSGVRVIQDFNALVRCGRRSEETKGYYIQKLGTLVRILGGDCLMGEITAPAVDRYIEIRREEAVTEHSIAKELGVLRVVLKTAKRNGWWAGDIDAILPHAFGTQAKPRERFISSMAELGRILRAIGNEDIAAQVAFSVAVGAEAQAIRRAQWADLSERFIAVHGKKRPTRERMVPVVASWQETLILFVRQHALGDRERGNPMLFVHTQGIPKALREACAKLGLPHTCPNDLRRTFNVWMDAAGVPVALRAQAMGHASTKLLDKFTYGKLPPDILRSRMMETFDGRSERRGSSGNDSQLRPIPNRTVGVAREGDGGGVDRGQEVQGGARARGVADKGADGRRVLGADLHEVRETDDRALNSVVQLCQSGVTDGSALNRTEPDDSTPAANDPPLEMAPRAGIEPATYGLTDHASTEGNGASVSKPCDMTQDSTIGDDMQPET